MWLHIQCIFVCIKILNMASFEKNIKYLGRKAYQTFSVLKEMWKDNPWCLQMKLLSYNYYVDLKKRLPVDQAIYHPLFTLTKLLAEGILLANLIYSRYIHIQLYLHKCIYLGHLWIILWHAGKYNRKVLCRQLLCIASNFSFWLFSPAQILYMEAALFGLACHEICLWLLG